MNKGGRELVLHNYAGTVRIGGGKLFMPKSCLLFEISLVHPFFLPFLMLPNSLIIAIIDNINAQFTRDA